MEKETLAMIEDVLRTIHDQGVMNMKEIAAKIGIEESTLEQVMSLLVSKGYVRNPDNSQSSPTICAGCHMVSQCYQEKNESIYIITEKGERYVRANDKSHNV
jgi:nitrate/TMAO reductase-like tetraheme cytochrome c subunit